MTDMFQVAKSNFSAICENFIETKNSVLTLGSRMEDLIEMLKSSQTILLENYENKIEEFEALKTEFQSSSISWKNEKESLLAEIKHLKSIDYMREYLNADVKNILNIKNSYDFDEESLKTVNPLAPKPTQNSSSHSRNPSQKRNFQTKSPDDLKVYFLNIKVDSSKNNITQVIDLEDSEMNHEPTFISESQSNHINSNSLADNYHEYNVSSKQGKKPKHTSSSNLNLSKHSSSPSRNRISNNTSSILESSPTKSKKEFLPNDTPTDQTSNSSKLHTKQINLDNNHSKRFYFIPFPLYY
ncbi:hypothetical protein AYI69_g2280 [Smittium culicis]|uniref:Uncharacterized protein n=1 Tax=Smittium culicis TaxID=133412 RepID=A0A1R1YMV6_9FUNG|nr:hypothetical protein AYI69_g2280 [Smittium culicis]